MRTALRFASLICILSVCVLWYWPRGHAACAGADEPQSCRLVVEALEAASKLKTGMLRADIERDFDSDGGMSVQDHGIFTYRRCHYIKIEVDFKIRGNPPNTYAFSPDDEVSKISKPYLAYPVSD